MFTNTTHQATPSILVLGQPFNPMVTFWPETSQYNYRLGFHELVMFYDQPSKQEIRNIRQGRAEFRFCVQDGIIFFLHAFGTPIVWSDCPYTWHMIPNDQQTLPPTLSPAEKMLLQIVLVDATSGIVHALRLVTLDYSFCQALHAAISNQANQPFSQSEYDRRLGEIYMRASPHELAQMSAARCMIPENYKK